MILISGIDLELDLDLHVRTNTYSVLIFLALVCDSARHHTVESWRQWPPARQHQPWNLHHHNRISWDLTHAGFGAALRKGGIAQELATQDAAASDRYITAGQRAQTSALLGPWELFCGQYCNILLSLESL